MRKLVFIASAASLFAVMPAAAELGPIGSAIALVWLGVLLAVCASGTFAALAIAAGAVGALGSGMLGAALPAAAGAILLGAAFAERTMRVRSSTARAVHVLLALATGALAGSIAAAYTDAGVAVHLVAVAVAAVLAALPLLVDADDPVAYALAEAAEAVSEPAKTALAAGADLRRTAIDVPLDRATRARVRTTWQSLLKLADARMRLERRRTMAEDGAGPTTADAVTTMVDKRIGEHIAVLAAAYTAVDTASAALLSLDDAALKNVAQIGETLDDVSRAMVEEVST